ncbi:AbrB/MazE/SpoVT family DNA-binding domain-containing protein [Paenibacillus sp.]|jgi:transcriptional pleiotropic regulator of transition state genes|uniref:AbrB/MazE/SpoVT family DNA-binding domain-containing protein n=1 Tax=Paenibacillus sp. TaxID=58172 RepID=UPI0028338231|nr:AbrB/MazE/SpoVT family DNA-binding domain-containing protein [Paenibacillus sp.]MDR0268396.1 AbrB/MazE/SpoVT family DNA-binding domain-containing protein [Paenibacillus sp.]
MKATGIVRNLDVLGRIVLPIELRKTLDIDIREPLEIFVDDSRIILKKYHPGCTLCGSLDGLSVFRQKYVCQECMSEILSIKNKIAATIYTLGISGRIQPLFVSLMTANDV